MFFERFEVTYERTAFTLKSYLSEPSELLSKKMFTLIYSSFLVFFLLPPLSDFVFSFSIFVIDFKFS